MIPSADPARALALLALHRGRLFNEHRNYARAAQALPEAVRHFQHTGEGDNHAKALYALGRALLGLGDAHAARERLEHALTFIRSRLLTTLAGRDACGARQCYRRPRRCRGTPAHAEAIYAKLGDARVDDIQRRLATVNRADENST